MKKILLTTSVISICALLLASCAQSETTVTDSASSTVNLTDEPVAFADTLSVGTRDNTPICLVPAASGITVYSNALASIDASNAAEGYIMVNYKGNISAFFWRWFL